MNLEMTLELPNPSLPFIAEEQRTRKLRRFAQGHWVIHRQNIIPMCSSDLEDTDFGSQSGPTRDIELENEFWFLQ